MRDSSEQLPLHFERYDIDAHRRLVPASVETAIGLEEFYDAQLASRVISMPKAGQEAHYHEELHEARLPVFSAMYRDEGLFLLVPDATRTIRKVLPLIGRDLASYSEIFFELGRALGRLDNSPFGLPEASSDRSILDSVAFAPDDSAAFGGKICLIPPYRLDAQRRRRRDQVVDAVYEELRYSRYLSEEAAVGLTDTMVNGWQAELYHYNENKDG